MRWAREYDCKDWGGVAVSLQTPPEPVDNFTGDVRDVRVLFTISEPDSSNGCHVFRLAGSSAHRSNSDTSEAPAGWRDRAAEIADPAASFSARAFLENVSSFDRNLVPQTLTTHVKYPSPDFVLSYVASSARYF